MKKIPLSNSDAFALIDDEDYELIRRFRWRLNKRGNHAQATILMHRLITDCPSGLIVDHINRNPLDNRRTNLRVGTRSQNEGNKWKPSIENSTSRYKGVSKKENGWEACISRQGAAIYLGRFTSEIAAARVYDEAAKHYFGEFAKLNFPENPDVMQLQLGLVLNTTLKDKLATTLGVNYCVDCDSLLHISQLVQDSMNDDYQNVECQYCPLCGGNNLTYSPMPTIDRTTKDNIKRTLLQGLDMSKDTEIVVTIPYADEWFR